MESYHLWEATPAENLWWAPYVKDFRQLSTSREPVRSINRSIPSDRRPVAEGAACRAIALDAPQYLSYLQGQAVAKGVLIFKSSLPTDGGLEKALMTAEGICKVIGRGAVDCFVNATGLGALKLCDDKLMYPVCGQTVLVKGEAHAIRTFYPSGAGSDLSYCIPRPGSGTTILGGTKEVNVWRVTPDEAVTERILENASYMVPELLTAPGGTFEVISAQCGLRPARRGGPRTDRQRVSGRTVIHSYGHAGAGYQNSIGAALFTVDQIDQICRLGVYEGGARL